MRKRTPSGQRALSALRVSRRMVVILLISCQSGVVHAHGDVDVVAYFQRIESIRGAGQAQKTKPVDARAAAPGEIIVTVIKGEGKETQSPPAKPGDMVVRNRCPETGNEEFLVSSESFSRKYQGPIGAAARDGWLPYRPRAIPMRFVVVAEQDGQFTFTAPWGESMVARPGDAIVQDPDNAKDTYRVAREAFACTYEVLQEPQH